MYRRSSRFVLRHPVCRCAVVSAAAWCSSGNVPPAGGNKKGNTSSGPRRAVRRVVPSDEEMADLHNTDRDAAASSRATSVLTNVAADPMRFAAPGGVGAGGGGGGRIEAAPADPLCDFVDEGDDEDDDVGAVAVPNGGGEKELDGGGMLLRESHATAFPSVPHIDCLLQDETVSVGAAVRQGIMERQVYLRSLSPSELVDMVVLYLRATQNPRLVSAEEEHMMFPVLMDRLNEFHVDQMLDIVECHWARSTLVRYGTTFKDMVRDRIAMIASVAAKGASKKGGISSSGGDDGGAVVSSENSINDGNEDNRHRHNSNDNNNNNNSNADDDDDDDTAVYTHEVQSGVTDPILLGAVDEMRAEGVLRCVVVMGMSAGRRKRDLQFFQAMGMFLVHHINHYRDPHDLVRVLTAFARAKIVPPKRFLALLGRRFAVLNKRKPLGALPSYRAFVNLYKMGHDQMNSFRFLANCIFETIHANVKSEKKQRRLLELRRSGGEANAPAAASVDAGADAENVKGELAAKHALCADGNGTGIIGDLDPHLLHVVRARERFKRLTELKPSMFTKLLLVLARFGAPHQQYLRPTTEPLILPTLCTFPPPSFSRLLRAMRLFRTTDLDLIEPIIDHLADTLGPAGVSPADVLEVIRVVAPADVPVPRNLAKLLALCEAVYSGGGAPTALAPIRPSDMCAVAVVLLKIQLKDDIPLDVLDPLTRLMESFADRLSALMRLHVVSLTHVDIFVDLCQQQQHPDVSGRIARLRNERRHVSAAEGDDEYYSRLDIDVRETFHKIMMVNDFNTYRQYRPTPGVLQVDFRQALTEVSAFDVLEATHLFAQAFPNALQPTVERHLSRSILAKLDGGGEEVITEEHTVVLRPPRRLLLTKEDLVKFLELLQATPLKRVRASPAVWDFVKEKARRLKMNELFQAAQQQQSVAVTAAA